MKEIDTKGLFNCAFQGDLFARSLDFTDFSSPTFIKNYMLGDFALHFDFHNIENEAVDIENIFSDINSKYSARGNKRFSESSMFWIGYTYRYWCYTYGISSKQVYSYINGTEMNKLFEPYHTMDCSKAIERIIEAKNIVVEDPLSIAKRIYLK